MSVKSEVRSATAHEVTFQWRPTPFRLVSFTSTGCPSLRSARWTAAIGAVSMGYRRPRWWQWWRWFERRLPLEQAIVFMCRGMAPGKLREMAEDNGFYFDEDLLGD